MTTHLEDITNSVNSNYDSLNSQLDYMIDDRQKEKNLYKDFINKMNEVTDGFLNQVMPTRHVGDTPVRQPEIRRRVLDSLAPREVLLQRFTANLDITFEEEVNIFS